MNTEAVQLHAKEVFWILFDIDTPVVIPDGQLSDTVLDMTCIDGVWQFIQ